MCRARCAEGCDIALTATPIHLLQLLLSRIGDTLMLYLLTHASMFVELPNACCLQLRWGAWVGWGKEGSGWTASQQATLGWHM